MSNQAPQIEQLRAELSTLEALDIALRDAQGVMDLLFGARDGDAAREALLAHYDFSDTQADAVMSMQWSRVTERDRQRIRQQRRVAGRRLQDLLVT
ncbi:hypothetical protein [Nocardioides pacificus]